MHYTELDQHLCLKTGVEKDFQQDWQADRYRLGGKMFAFHGSDNQGREIFTFKVEPLYGELLREQHPGKIIPGYYMNKQHWISVLMAEGLPAEIWQDIMDNSYRVILASLPKKLQKELVGEA